MIYHKDHSIKTNDRDLPVSMDLIFAIDDYVCNIRPQVKEFDTIFVNHRGYLLGHFMKKILRVFLVNYQLGLESSVHLIP